MYDEGVFWMIIKGERLELSLKENWGLGIGNWGLGIGDWGRRLRKKTE